ncbi:haloperoxidase [Putridiphycobacter roseus]|uniref:Haloperoxidase n=1 Tax=Putridiphycobacter roseus TaxID=2219161 RepID=A0A2W1MY00_9FLAO|nr:vanadium-dependent haloperoxidase [Putridiphycobacter roseus]PZE16254.1 haloperoxidase [Putridiphycobacter roseus]
MGNKLFFYLTLNIFLWTSCSNDSTSTTEVNTSEVSTTQKKGNENVAHIWADAALYGTAMDTDRFEPRPTITSRYLGLIFTAIFDAWTFYDKNAIPVYATGIEKRSIAEQTVKNKEEAISYAALRTLNEYYYSDSVYFKNLMKDLGYDPENRSLEPTTAAGIGNLVAKTIIERRSHDGANQYATAPGSKGMPYFDYTQYNPKNSVDIMVDLKRWQPKYFKNKAGKKYDPGCLTPYWQNVEPIALDSAAQFRPGPPPTMDSEQLKVELAEVVSMQEDMSDYDKALVEFMRDGPLSVQQAGHWLKFSQFISERDKHTLDEDVKMYFLVQTTAMDGFIACWDSKIYYDYARPYALVHSFYKDKKIKCWAGDGKGFHTVNGDQWMPYSPESFLCPSFPSYVSGHSTISGGCAEALLLFTGNEYFGDSATLVAGALTESNVADHGDTITLKFPTFTEASEMAGQSRVMGGYHIQSDNIAGLKLGRDVAHQVWEFYQAHLNEK